MKIDAHYYALLAFARGIGFKKEFAHKIAYSSQFVDDAKINNIMLNEEPDGISYELISEEPSFFNIATCHSYFRLNTFNYEAMINNTTAFHFVPGCKGENFTKKLRCFEESPIIMDILSDLEKDDSLVKLGIALHAYADTFSHQGFSGLISKVNDIKDCRPKSRIYENRLERILRRMRKLLPDNFDMLFDKLNPAYGHGQALTYPDIPYLKWEYKYDYSDEYSRQYKITKIDNRERFEKAFTKIKIYLSNYLDNHPIYKDRDFNFNNFNILFDALFKEGSTEERINNWKRVLIEQDLFTLDDTDIISYQENLWLKEAFKDYQEEIFNNRKVEGVELSLNFKDSNWYNYYKAVKWYKDKFHYYASKHLLEIPR